MKYLSTFSGIGGFELGIQQAYVATNKEEEERIWKEDKESLRSRGDEGSVKGHEKLADSGDTGLRQHPDGGGAGQPVCVGFSEIDKYATQIYEKHFPNHKNYGDITQIDAASLPDFDLLVGGFPCQSFSIAGHRKGFNDTRGTMFFEIARIVKQKQPRLLLLENVKGLLSHDKGNTFTTIISTLDELGYDCQWQVLNSKNHGVPQNRERVFIIGHLRGTSRPQVFPFGGESKENQGEVVGTLMARDYKGVGNQEMALAFRNDETKIRRLTPTECERLQGFPSNFTKHGVDEQGQEVVISDTQRYKVLGNAVTTNVIKDIVCQLLK